MYYIFFKRVQWAYYFLLRHRNPHTGKCYTLISICFKFNYTDTFFQNVSSCLWFLEISFVGTVSCNSMYIVIKYFFPFKKWNFSFISLRMKMTWYIVALLPKSSYDNKGTALRNDTRRQ